MECRAHSSVKAPVLAPGGRLAPVLSGFSLVAYESMIAAIDVVWALIVLRGAGDPARHSIFVEFTIRATAAHALVMLIATPMRKGLIMTGVGVPSAVPFAFVRTELRTSGERSARHRHHGPSCDSEPRESS